jgi:hypothetical protein
VVRLRLSELRLCRPRQWGACWLALQLWRELHLDQYFEVNASDLPEGDKRRHGYSRDKRPDCPQLVIALVVTPEGLPLAYEVLPGNTADCKTLRLFLNKIEQQSCPCEGEGRQGAARLGDGSRCADRGGSG